MGGQSICHALQDILRAEGVGYHIDGRTGLQAVGIESVAVMCCLLSLVWYRVEKGYEEE